MAIRNGTIVVKRPKRTANRADPATVSRGLVVVAEIDPPAGVVGLEWWLLTTLPVATKAEALEIVRLYRLRWRIEEVFRTLNTGGLDLAAIGIAAAVRIVQLVDARDGSRRPATDVVDAGSVPAVAAIGRALEGATKRPKNPCAKGSLAWLSWVVARLGGWNCDYRSPGPKTMARGWRRLADRLQGFEIAQSLAHV